MGGDGVQMPKFFVSKENITDSVIKIIGDDVNHIKRVLRLKSGDNIIVCDGEGTDYNVEIADINQDSVYTNVISSNLSGTEAPVDITLFQGVPKSDKMDFIIQKSVELGVRRIVPVITERTVVKIESKKDKDNKTSRWQRIASEAAKQCNRGIIPDVSEPVKYVDGLKMAQEFDLSIIPYEKEEESRLRLYLQDKSIKRISVFIGPEGGFTETEIQAAIINNVRPVTLGPRILRTETAGITALSILMYELGDI